MHAAELFCILFRTFFFTYTSKTSLSDVTRSAAIVLVTLSAPRQLGTCYVGAVALDLSRARLERSNKPRDY